MKYCILAGSPRKNGNTCKLLAPILSCIEGEGDEYKLIHLYEKSIEPCRACRMCQRDWSIFGCPTKDDVQAIFDTILESDVLLLATPVYSWYCTPPLKALLDRLVYGMNKYYGEEKGPSLWKGKKLALLVTCGYRPEKGADLLEEGMKRYCKHSELTYMGMLAERDLGYAIEFMDEDKAKRACEFAGKICGRKSNEENL